MVVNHIKGDGRGEISLFLNGGVIDDMDSRDTGYTNWAVVMAPGWAVFQQLRREQ